MAVVIFREDHDDGFTCLGASVDCGYVTRQCMNSTLGELVLNGTSNDDNYVNNFDDEIDSLAERNDEIVIWYGEDLDVETLQQNSRHTIEIEE